MFRDFQGNFEQFHLLKDLDRLVGIFQLAATAGATLEVMEPSKVDLFRIERGPLVPSVPGLTTPLPAFLFRFGGSFFRVYNIAGRWLGGITRVFFGLGQLILALGQLAFQLFNLGQKAIELGLKLDQTLIPFETARAFGLL